MRKTLSAFLAAGDDLMTNASFLSSCIIIHIWNEKAIFKFSISCPRRPPVSQIISALITLIYTSTLASHGARWVTHTIGELRAQLLVLYRASYDAVFVRNNEWPVSTAKRWAEIESSHGSILALPTFFPSSTYSIPLSNYCDPFSISILTIYVDLTNMWQQGRSCSPPTRQQAIYVYICSTNNGSGRQQRRRWLWLAKATKRLLGPTSCFLALRWQHPEGTLKCDLCCWGYLKACYRFRYLLWPHSTLLALSMLSPANTPSIRANSKCKGTDNGDGYTLSFVLE